MTLLWKQLTDWFAYSDEYCYVTAVGTKNAFVMELNSCVPYPDPPTTYCLTKLGVVLLLLLVYALGAYIGHAEARVRGECHNTAHHTDELEYLRATNDTLREILNRVTNR